MRSAPTGAPRRGFTLIELLVTVAIVAILAAVAYPSYSTQVDKARRATMQGELVRLAQFMERIYSENGRYNPDDQKPSIPDDFEYYTVSILVDSQTFILTATPKPNGPPGDLTIDHRGQRTWDGKTW
ncbi:MAG: prepilin-type N-terminal cleavage/methylation domain-containing protein [Chromatiaceae bacterium]|nr:MAG: prepilin-type N-terminal cleavage/methylation domain-containing protein [Chromatiaceae bacterium]